MADLVDAGGKCPNCGEDRDVEGKAFDGCGDEAWQQVRCLRCGCVYDEVYKYAGTEVVEEGDPAVRKGA